MTWKQQLAGKMPADWAQEIDDFETQMFLKKAGKIDDKLFAEARLRRGAYGQRYDNGQRHDGTKTQQLKFITPLTKGPETFWDAPGMHRIKVPFGGLTTAQLDVLADVAEEYADSILHVTTRQDFQLHFVHIEDTPDLMRRLTAVGITTREACGNSVRNVTACPLAGVCHTEAFDVTPYANAMFRYLLGHPDTQDFGRKFKIAFSGCEHEGCGLVGLHDMGAIALKRVENGVEKRGFRLMVGGGLGAVPYQAKAVAEFLPVEELLPMSRAIARVFARLGEKQNRARARIKFVVAKLGIDEFIRVVNEEYKSMPPDPRMKDYLTGAVPYAEEPLKKAAPSTAVQDPAYAEWVKTNAYPQRQPGYMAITILCPLGDITSAQARKISDIARKYSGDTMRTTVEQNLVLRWVSESDLPAVYRDLKAICLADSGANTILDVTSCPGTDTCKLGIASSRGLARELSGRFKKQFKTMDPAIAGLRIKMSGCFNSCGQHHVADLGFYGNSRTVDNRKVPHFQVVLGGMWKENAGSYGLAIAAVPSHRVPDVVECFTQRFLKEKQGDETFQQFIARIGKAECRKMLDPFMAVPSYAQDPSFYSDWGDPREYTIGDLGTGECAGEIVSRLAFELQAAEQMNFNAQLKLEAKEFAAADALAYKSMLVAARGLIREEWLDAPEDPQTVAEEFKRRFLDTGIFTNPNLAQYFTRRHEGGPVKPAHDTVHRLVEEAQLFLEAVHLSSDKLRTLKAAATVASK